MEVLRRDERLADQLGADHDTVALDQRAVGRVAPADLGDRGDHQWVGETRITVNTSMARIAGRSWRMNAFMS